MNTDDSREITNPILHKVRGVVSRIMGEGIILLKTDAQQFSNIKDLPNSMQVNLRNFFGDAELKKLRGKRVLIYTSSIPEAPDDIVFGTVQLLDSNSDYAGSVAPAQVPLEITEHHHISGFVQTWTGLKILPPVFEGMARITFLFANTRYTERVKVRFNIRWNGGSIELINSGILDQYKLPTHYDSRFHTFSLRPGGSLCVIGQDDVLEDYVFWVNHDLENPPSIPLIYFDN